MKDKHYKINDLRDLTKKEYFEFSQVVEKNFKNGDLLCCRAKGLISLIICKLTKSAYSHAGMVFTFNDCVYCLEATWKGVKLAKFSEIIDDFNIIVDYFEVLEVSESQRKLAVSFCFEQVGKKYDRWGILKFFWYLIFKKMPKIKDDGRWFCSELFDTAYKKCGVKLSEIDEHYIAPGDLADSGKVMRKISFSNDWKIYE